MRLENSQSGLPLSLSGNTEPHELCEPCEKSSFLQVQPDKKCRFSQNPCIELKSSAENKGLAVANLQY
jgi:hypothetical protein